MHDARITLCSVAMPGRSWCGPGTQQAIFLLAGLLLPLGIFMALAWMVSNAITVPFDAPVLIAIHETARPILDSAFLLISSLGYGFGLVPFDVLFTLWLAFKRRWRDSIFALVALGGSFGLNTLAKHVFERARPHLWNPISLEGTYSFPSGHAMASATLGVVIVVLTTRTRTRPLLIAVVATLILLIGISRVYLGVHYPSDVVGGWAAGLAWTTTCYALILRGVAAGHALPPISK